MVSHQASIDLLSEKNEILLNPRFPQADYEKLYALAEKIQQLRNLKSHVWIATSGSTAASAASTKLVALSKQALKASADSVNHHLQASHQDVWTQVLPSFHVGGLGIEIRAQLAGAKVVGALQEGKWNAVHFYETILQERCTLSALVPTQVYDLVAHQLRAPETLRAVVVGGGAFEHSLYQQARALSWPVLPSYGMTETASQIATASLQSLQQNEFPDIHLLSHAQARTTEDGHLQVQASSLLTCYAQNFPEGPHHWDPKVNGWFTSEDRGEVRRNILKILGRSGDYIKIGGEGSNVAKLRGVLEQTLLEIHPHEISQVCLLDVASERLGSEIHLVVSQLSAHIAEKIANSYGEKVLPYEKIRKIHFVEEIPRTALGKIQWSALRSRLC